MKRWIPAVLFLVCGLFLLTSVRMGEGENQMTAVEEAGTTEKFSWEVTYVLNGGTNSILNPDRITTKTPLPMELYSPYKAGYNFSGWYSDAACQQRVEQLTEQRDITLYAKWTLIIDSLENIKAYPYQSSGQGDTRCLRDLSFALLYQIETPGNPQTRWMDFQNHYIDSENQCPQGLCMTKDYVIISTYSAGEEDEESLGALIFYDRETGEHVKSFGMESESHLGGIAYDGENLWICHSNTREVERISFDFLEHLIRISKQNFIDISGCFSRYPVRNTPSCIAYEDGKLYVATHRIYASARMYVYRYHEKEDTLEVEEGYFIPSKVQGVTFDGEGRVYLSTSYGRSKSSYLYVYDSLKELESFFAAPRLRVEMPPGSEEILRQGDELYILFETACYKYYEGTDGNGTCDYPLDKIVILDLASLFYD